jgi:hypothetical protein
MSVRETTNYKAAIGAVLLAPVIIPSALVVLLGWILASMIVVLAASLAWRARGISFLIVYSDSAQWKRYFEEDVLPVFGRSARVLNLSVHGARKRWWHLDWCIYRHCAGYKNRFPIVVRFSTLGRWEAVRFYDAFMQAKKGRNRALEEAKTQLATWNPNHA